MSLTVVKPEVDEFYRFRAIARRHGWEFGQFNLGAVVYRALAYKEYEDQTVDGRVTTNEYGYRRGFVGQIKAIIQEYERQSDKPESEATE